MSEDLGVTAYPPPLPPLPETAPRPSSRAMSSHPDRVRWGIIGCGDVTEKKSGPALQKADGSELVAVMRRDGAKAADYARRHGVPSSYDDARALVTDPEVDAVYVATPPGAHVEGALLAAAAGKPCYVEKPFARNATECDAILGAFRAANQPAFAASRIADVANPPWRLDAANAGAGLFLDLGSHALDLLDHLLGPLDNVRGHAANRATPLPVEDTVAMTFTTVAGLPGVASWNF